MSASNRQGDPAGPGAGFDGDSELARLRDRISRLDDELIHLVAERRDLVLQVGRTKARMGVPVLDPTREAEVVRRAAERARSAGVDPELVRDVIWRIIAGARVLQEELVREGKEPDGAE